MNAYFYGIIESKEAKNFGPIGFSVEGQGKGVVVARPGRNHLATVIGPGPRVSFEGLSKESLVKVLLAHQQTLEIIMRGQFILPCKFATVLKDEREIQEILLQHELLLAQWFDNMKDSHEWDVIATWDPPSILREIAERDPEILDMRRRFESLSLADRHKEQIASGMLLATKLRERAASVTQEILSVLKEASRSYATHKVINDAMVFNASFLLVRGAEEGFFKTLEGLDRQWEGKLHFKGVGPLPPYSFACLTLKRFDPNEIRWARETLGLRETLHLDQVHHAYRERARECHPDAHPELDKEPFETIHRARELLVEYIQGGCHPITVALFHVAGETL